MGSFHRRANHAARCGFIEPMESRILLTVFAPDLTYQPAAKPHVGDYTNVTPVSKGRFIATSYRTEAIDGDSGDTFITYSRIFADGTLDKTFGQKGHLTFDTAVIKTTFTGSRFIVVTTGDTTATLNVYTVNGKSDESVGSGTGSELVPFNAPPLGTNWVLDDVELEHTYSDGGMLITVSPIYVDQESQQGYQLLKLKADGTLDPSFGTNGITTIAVGPGTSNQIVLADDGIYLDILRGATVTPPSDLLFRFTPDGKADTAFGNQGSLIIPAFSQNFMELPGGKILFLEVFFHKPLVVHRLNQNGTPDTSLNGTGSLTVNVPASIQSSVIEDDQDALYVDSQKRILVANGGTIFRYSNSGTLDAYPFNGTAQFDGFTITEDDQGRILTSSSTGSDISDERYALVPNTQVDSNGIAHIVGTTGADTVTVGRISNGRYQFVVNGETMDVSAPKVKEIDINLFNGDSTIDIDASVDAPASIQSGVGDDSIVTGNGDDTITCADSSDTIHCGDGNDLISVADGNIDQISGLPNHHIAGGSGNKHISIDSGGAAYLMLGVGNNTIYAYSEGSTHVSIAGGSNSLSMYGPSNNVIIGGDGDNSISTGNKGNQQITAGDGNDTITINGASSATIHGGGGNDNITALREPDTIYGEGGSDTIVAGGGADYISGGGGNDNLIGLSGNDTLIGGAGGDTLNGGSDDDYLSGNDGVDTIHGGDGDDTIAGGAGSDWLYAENDNDLIHGQGGNDHIFGDYPHGTDTLFGGPGDDRFVTTDKQSDSIDGGDGNDSADADQSDVLKSVEN